MKFINRQQELEFLEKKFNSGEAELIIIYGRRRIGKTELILRFCENKKFIYFMGRLESKENTLKRFNDLLIENFYDKKLLNNPLSNWDAIFDYLTEKLEKRIILIFDEFPLVVEKFPEIISILQDKWDAKLKNSMMMLVLCGSSVSMMEKYALDLKSPLYGRRTGQWKVEKININHIKEFFPDYKIEEIIGLYACLDTIPGYLMKFFQEKNLFENIKEKILSKGEFLYDEVEILLREEFRDPSNYMSIISSIAGGLTTLNEIKNRTGLDKSLLSKYLHVLENVGIIERIIPITETYKTKLKYKGALYVIKDNFFDFWFRFVYLNRQELEKGEVNSVLELIKKELNQYLSRKFEKFVIEFIQLVNRGNFNKTGRWWDKDEEIDITAINEKDNIILFGECKWQDNVDAVKVVNPLMKKSKEVNWKNKDRKEIYAIFAKSFSKKINNLNNKKVYCLDLKDIEKTIREKNGNNNILFKTE